MKIALKILQKYNRAVRCETQKGFKINLPLCKFVELKQSFAIVDKEFFLNKKDESLKDFENYKKETKKISYKKWQEYTKRLKNLRTLWHANGRDKKARLRYELEAKTIKAKMANGHKKPEYH